MSLKLDLSKLESYTKEEIKELCDYYNINEVEAQLNTEARVVTWCYDSDLEELFRDSGIKVNIKSIYVEKIFAINEDNEPLGLRYGDYIETIELCQNGKNYYYPVFCVYNGCSADTGIAFFNPISKDTVDKFIESDNCQIKLKDKNLLDSERDYIKKVLLYVEDLINIEKTEWLINIGNECKLKENNLESDVDTVQSIRPVKRWQYSLTTILYEHYSGIVEAKSETLAEALILDKLGQTNSFYIKALTLIPMPADTFIIIKEEIQNNMSKETLERFISNLIEKNCELKNYPYKYEIKDCFDRVHIGTITIPINENDNLKYIAKNLLGIPKEFIESSNIQPIKTSKEIITGEEGDKNNG